MSDIKRRQDQPFDGEQLSRYLEHDLDENEMREVEHQLNTHEDMRRELEELKQTLSLMSTLTPMEAPADFSQKVRRRVRRFRHSKKAPQSSFALHWSIGGILLVVVAMMVVLYYMLQGNIPTP